MNNKGFTIIEIVGIVLVLAAIFLVSFPLVSNMTRADKEKQYNLMIEDLCTAGKSYIYSNMDRYSNLSTVNSTISINVQDLMTYGNVDSNLKNPKTDISVNDDNLTYTVLDDYSLDCEYIDN